MGHMPWALTKEEEEEELPNHKTYLLTYLFTYLLTDLLTPCSTAPLEKLKGFQLVKKYPAIYGTLRFITAFTSARHLSLS
jgi:hypothetical protein